MNTKLILVVPAFNEARRLDRAAFTAFLDGLRTAELLFVNDGSSDGTEGVLREMESANPRVRVLSLDRNSGKAEAVRQGVLAAFARNPEYIGYWDADLATPLSAAAELLSELERCPNTLLVMGSRVRLLGRTITRRPARHYLGRVFSTAASLTLGLGAYDTQCGAKLFRAVPEVRACFAHPFSSRWIFDVEVLARLASSQPAPQRAPTQLIREFPLSEWRDLGDSRLSLPDFIRAPWELLGIYWRLRRRRRA